MEHSGGVLVRTCGGGIRLSRQKLRQAEAIDIVRLKREQRAQTLAFSSGRSCCAACPCAVCPLTSFSPSGATTCSCCRSGHPEFGVPVGEDRLVPIFLATLAISRRVKSSGSELPTRCWRVSACTRAARSIAGCCSLRTRLRRNERSSNSVQPRGGRSSAVVRLREHRSAW